MKMTFLSLPHLILTTLLNKNGYSHLIEEQAEALKNLNLPRAGFAPEGSHSEPALLVRSTTTFNSFKIHQLVQSYN